MPFDFRKLDIPEIILVESGIFNDERSFFHGNIYKYYVNQGAATYKTLNGF